MAIDVDPTKMVPQSLVFSAEELSLHGGEGDAVLMPLGWPGMLGVGYVLLSPLLVLVHATSGATGVKTCC